MFTMYKGHCRCYVGAAFFLFLTFVQAFVSTIYFTRTPLLRFSQGDADDSPLYAQTLPLSDRDRERISQLRSRQLTIPIVVLDAMVPLQQLVFRSTDPKFRKLIETCLIERQYVEVGMFGLNPWTKRPLCHGVSFPVNNSTVELLDNEVIQLKVHAQRRRLEVQGEPWLDETESFYMALVEVTSDQPDEAITAHERENAQRLSDTLPALVEEWKNTVLLAGITDQKGLEIRCAPLGPMPTSLVDRAFWVAALINPLPPLGVCLEIRPTMLAADNDYERMLLACEAIQGSIDHMTGKKKLL